MASSKLSPREDRAPVWLGRGAALLIVLGVLLAYANSLRGPFVFDDVKGIVNNETIRSLWPLSDVLNPPMLATGAGGRPVVNLSLAINYAIGGMDVRGYHVFNMLIHALAALTLFGLLRRTLLRPVMREKYGRAAMGLSLAVALLWALHPLLTESVTGIIQRTESLGGLFYLLTLYTFVRSVEGVNVRRWQILCVFSCLVGMATKEIMATVPVIALLYDRTFVAGTFKAAWRARWRFYAVLMSTWLLLVYLVVINQSRGGMVGFGLGMSSWDYALTQCRAIILYLKLSFWPHPLVVDYGAGVVSGVSAVWWQGVVLLALIAATLWALVRKPMAGFAAFTFFSILAPSSSFIPLTTQTIAEHRMYLPLAAVVALVVLGLFGRWGKWVVPGALVLALVGGVATARRNLDYRTGLALWKDTVAKVPDNPRAHVNLGGSYSDTGQFDEAIKQFQITLKLEPDNISAEYNLGNAYLKKEQFAEAIRHYQHALKLNPNYGMAHYGLAYALIRTNRAGEALGHLEWAEQLRPDDPTILHTYASTLAFVGRVDEAMPHYEQLQKLTPDDPALPREIGAILSQVGRVEEAVPYLQKALAFHPRDIRTRYQLALGLLQLKRFATAADELSTVLKVRPDFAEGHNALGEALLGLERWTAAKMQFETALRLDPSLEQARRNLDRAEVIEGFRR